MRVLETILTLIVVGQVAPAAEPEIRSWELEPGTTLVLVEDRRAPLVELVVEFPVGSWSPWAAEHHAEEAFEVQLYDPEGRLRARADELAVDLGVRVTSRASTVRASCLRDDLEEVLALVSDLLRNDAFDPQELNRWKQNDKIQWKGSQKVPEFRLAQATARLAFVPGDPRRRPYEKPRPVATSAVGLVPVRDTVVRLPGRVIGFAGALDREGAQRLATGLLPRVSEEAPEGLEPRLQPMTLAPERAPEPTLTMGRITQTFFNFARPSLTYEDPSYPSFLIADHVLGGHFHSRIYTALRHEGGETYSARTAGKGGVTREAYGLRTFTRGENTAVTETKLREALAVFHEEGITEQEREAAAGFLLGRLPFLRQSPGQILRRSLWERRNGLPPDFYEDLVRRAAALPVGEVNAFIREFYDPSRFVMLKVEPD